MQVHLKYELLYHYFRTFEVILMIFTVSSFNAEKFSSHVNMEIMGCVRSVLEMSACR